MDGTDDHIHMDYKHDGLSPGSDYKDGLSPIQQALQYRSPSPALSSISRKSRESGGSGYEPKYDVDYGKFYNQSYLKLDPNKSGGPSPASSYKRVNTAADPKQPPKSPHFHRPENFSYSQVKRDFGKPMKKDVSDTLSPTRRENAGMLSTLGGGPTVTVIRKQMRMPAPTMNNKEAIMMSRFPDAYKPEASKAAPIEREDWPSPPNPAAAYPELLRDRSLKKEEEKEEAPPEDPKIKREIEELSKMEDSYVGQVILKDLEKKRAESPTLDPVSASRTPAANREPPYRTRYDIHIFASPSRDLEYRPRLRSMDDELLGRKYRTSTLPISNFPVPKPGYGLKAKSATLPVTARNGYSFDAADMRHMHMNNSLDDTLDPDHTLDRTSALDRSFDRSAYDKSDYDTDRSHHTSRSSIDEYDPETGLRRHTRMRSSNLSDGFGYSSYLSYRSMPSMFRSEEPPKIYPYEQLKITNQTLPPGVDQNTLERNLSKEEFESIFHMTRAEFARLAEWKRNDLKKRVALF